MKPKRAALYVRVSRDSQKIDAQESSLREYVKRRGWILHRVYRDVGISGSQSSGPALDELLRDSRRRAFDVVLVWKFDRFARSLQRLLSGLETFKAFGIDFVSITEAVDTSLPTGELVFQIFGAVAQFERSLIAERVKAGLDHARKKGKVLGRPPLRRLTVVDIKELRKQRRQRRVPFRQLAQEFGISVWTAHRLCQRAKKGENIRRGEL